MAIPVAAPPRTATPSAVRRGLHTASRSIDRARSFDLLVSAAIAGCAFALALSHPSSHAYIGDAQYGDAAYWDFNGEAWARGYVLHKAPDIRPGYSVFLGVIYSLTGADFAHAFVAQCLLFAAIAVMLYFTGKRLAGRMAGLGAAGLLTFNPHMWEWTATSTTEMLGSFANMAALMFMVEVCRPPFRTRGAVLFGVFIALANVVRVFTLFFVGPALVIMLLLRTSLATRARLIAVSMLAFLATLAPAVAYQYAMTGDPGLSSDTAAAVYAASSPKWGVWDPAIYEEVAAPLRAQGVEPTPKVIDAEFRRLTIQNYLTYPGFQIQRIARGFIPYLAYEGETERPDVYFFWRPYVLLGLIALAGAVASLSPIRRRVLAFAPAALFAAGLAIARVPVIVTATATAVVGAGVVTLPTRGPRQLGFLAVAAFWAITGVLAVMTAGVQGFLLSRLYTQVEPAHCLLLAVAITAVVAAGFRPGSFARARLLNLSVLVWRAPRLPHATRTLLAAISVLLALTIVFGGARLVLANVSPPASGTPYTPPSPDNLSQLAASLGLPAAVKYVDTASFSPVRTQLMAGTLQPDLTAYAVPGQFTRFLWQPEGQDRTLFWYVFSEGPRPTALDMNLITGEATGHLTSGQFGNRQGLLILFPTYAYFDRTGEVRLQDVVGVRAFVPWDAARQTFAYDAPIVFPFATRLYDHARFETAHLRGKVTEAGLIRVQSTDVYVRSLELQGPGEASVTYPGLWVPPGGTFQSSISLMPSAFNRGDLGPVHFEARIATAEGEQFVGESTLDPTDRSQQRFLPFDVDLGAFGGSTVDLTIQVSAPNAAPGALDVLLGEPLIRMP